MAAMETHEVLKVINQNMIDKLQFHRPIARTSKDYVDPSTGATITLGQTTDQYQAIYRELTDKITNWEPKPRTWRIKNPPSITLADTWWEYKGRKQYIPTEPALLQLMDSNGNQLWLADPESISEAGTRVILSPMVCNRRTIEDIKAAQLDPISEALGLPTAAQHWIAEHVETANDAVYARPITAGDISLDANGKLGDLFITKATTSMTIGECERTTAYATPNETAENYRVGNDRKNHILGGYNKGLELRRHQDKMIRMQAAGFTRDVIGEPLHRWIHGFGPRPPEQLYRWEDRTGRDWLREHGFNTLQDLITQWPRYIAEKEKWRLAEPTQNEQRCRWPTAAWWDKLRNDGRERSEPIGTHQDEPPIELLIQRALGEIKQHVQNLRDAGQDDETITRFVAAPAELQKRIIDELADQNHAHFADNRKRQQQFINAYTKAKESAKQLLDFVRSSMTGKPWKKALEDAKQAITKMVPQTSDALIGAGILNRLAETAEMVTALTKIAAAGMPAG